MEMISASLHKSAVPGGAAKEENKASESDSTGKKSCGGKIVLQLEDKLVSAKSEMDEVMEENQRLRMCLNRILEDYRTLEMQYRDAIQQEAKKSPTTILTHQDQTEEPELIALSLGRTSSGKIRDERNKMPIVEKSDEGNEGLTLGLDCKLDVPKMLSQAETTSLNPSPENSLEEVKEEEGGESTRKTKAMNNAGDGGYHDEILQQNPVKRARVSVRVKCDTPTMNDGCQWRKYGQKIAKGNPCPRAYYRCTVAPSCPVRKQVQRCVEDMSVLITTYEGTHNHPLSVSATAMASTTSAAASMLLSGSSTSGGPGSSSTTSNLNGLNFYLSDNSRSKPFYLPNSSISSSSSYPTITLDLTSSSSSSSSHLSRLGNFPPRYPTMNLNFSSSQSSALPVVSWSNNGILGYGTQPCSKNQSTTSLSFQANPNETLYQSYLQKNTINPNQQTLAPDTIAAATKAITLDPSFQSALAAALSSIIGSGGTNNSTTGVQNVVEKSKHSVKSSDPFPTLSSFPSTTTNVKKCSPGFLERSSSSTSSQLGGLTFLSPSFPLSNSKSKSNSPGDDRDELI